MPDPLRPEPDLIVHSEHPFNAEPPLGPLCASLLTPQSRLYVRSHGNVPALDEASHRLRVDGLVSAPLDLSMGGLRERFPRRSVTAVMQCAGNRRADLHRLRPVSGDPWAPGAIGNAEWTGVSLADVLRAAGARTDAGLHVAFSARDEVEMPGEGRFRFGVSIPMAKAMSPDVLLAFAMNGEALAPGHGFPLRAVVPGFAGVRSPKWLEAITVQDAPSDNHMQQRDYRLVPPDATPETVDWARGVTINEMPLNSAICEPARHATPRCGPAPPPCAATRSRARAPSCASTSPPTAGEAGARRGWSTTRPRRGAGRCGRPASTSPPASTSWRSAPGTPRAKRSPPRPGTPGTSRDI